MQSRESSSGNSIYRKTEIASQYDSDRFGGRFGWHLESQEIETFCGQLDGSCKSVLDGGCGTGKLTMPLLKAGYKVIGADSSIEMLSIARQKGTSAGLSPELVVSDLQALAFKDKAFDCTVSSRVLMHLHDWRAGISELCRVTDHAIVFDFPTTFSFAGLDSLLRKIVRRKADHPRQPYRTYRVRQVADALSKHSFVVLVTKRSYFLPTIMHRWMDRPQLSQKLERFCERVGLTRLFGAPATLKAVRVPVAGRTGPEESDRNQ
jgi:ubiquinone/menaquinone biosynthesis C-methylase UbiE